MVTHVIGRALWLILVVALLRRTAIRLHDVSNEELSGRLRAYLLRILRSARVATLLLTVLGLTTTVVTLVGHDEGL